MIVSINQPAYLPWLGYFHRIAVSDLHIVLDHVQFEKNSFTNRNKIRTEEGWIWLSVPVKTKGKFGNLGINELEIDNNNRWAKKHWASIKSNYAKAPYFTEQSAFFEEMYMKEWVCFNDLAKEMTGYLLNAFDVKTPLLFSSKMNVEGKKDKLVLNLCKSVGATIYLSGPLGKNYLDESLFDQAGIKVIYQDYNHPSYPQIHPGFEPFMSALDLLFNCGESRLAVLMSGNITKDDLMNIGASR